ncbi:LCP family protein [Ornithinibacillus halotolerans]|uniref:LytR family transcriptional regulator n=1 Tax=Ornithinibacillus halotolerans TaxID=1274357 RepID=A0A916RQ39_9BACI|nr:LCP family protein [Ornithinibacillus halotolerans]GGA64897.1 LytR family transcriptional regulator [Ornithinibacillus halotolerans]
MKKQKDARTRMEKRQTTKKSKKIYFILAPFIILLLVGGGFLINFYTTADEVISNAYEDDGREKSNLRETRVNPKEDNISILIIGVDESEHRANDGYSRSDTLILATLNKKDKSVKLVSIPRDSYVYIPEVGYNDKINHAHAFGGPKATIETVEQLLDVPVDYYVKLNFHAFTEVVDVIGGITAEVPYELWESDSNDKKNAIHLLPGEQLLNGEQALALARTRKYDSDIERGKRQMEIVKATIKKSLQANNILKLDNVIEAVGSNMTTNMSFSDMKSLVSYVTSGGNLDFETMTLAGESYMPASIWYWKLDELALEETKETLKEHLEVKTTLTDSSTHSLDTASGVE